eukprot:37788-Rhodomonas_salina.3
MISLISFLAHSHRDSGWHPPPAGPPAPGPPALGRLQVKFPGRAHKLPRGQPHPATFLKFTRSQPEAPISGVTP